MKSVKYHLARGYRTREGGKGVSYEERYVSILPFLEQNYTKLTGLLKSYLLIAKGEITLYIKHLCITVANIGRVG